MESKNKWIQKNYYDIEKQNTFSNLSFQFKEQCL